VRRLKDRDAAVSVEPGLAEVGAGVVRELLQKRALGVAVALANRMNAVDLGQVVGEAVDEGTVGEAAQVTFCGQSTQGVGQVQRDVLWQGEEIALAIATVRISPAQGWSRRCDGGMLAGAGGHMTRGSFARRAQSCAPW
jgi:hypothetical protein